MFIYKWIIDIFYYFGFKKKSARILFLGLDNAGKTTLLHMLSDNKLEIHEPTRHAGSQELTIENINFKTFDLGGHHSARRLWKEYFLNVDAVVYIIDAGDSRRFKESRKELNSLLNEDDLSHVPFLILGNKVDLPKSVSEEELRKYLGLVSFSKADIKNKRKIELFMCSIVEKIGFLEGFKWLSLQII